MKILSILIPTYNERDTIVQVLEKVSQAESSGLEKQIIVVDDGSSDGTEQILKSLDPKKYNVEIYFHHKNQGKGAAIRTAQSHVRGDIVLIQDADLEYDPNEYPELLRPILIGKADVVYGSRLSGAKVTRAFNIAHLIGNKFLSFLTNVLYNSTLTDMETGYKVFRSEVFQKVAIKSNRFEFEPEITAKVLKQGIRLYELPVSYYGRGYSEGKKITWKDGFIAIWALIKYRFF